MIGLALTTVSPSSSSTTRSTPCVEGCCGPMLSVMVSVRTVPDLLGLERGEIGGGNGAPRRVVRERHFLVAERRVLAQRPALPVVGQENPRQVGMTVEDDAVEVVRLALVPVGGRPHAGHGGHARRGLVELDLERDPG